MTMTSTAGPARSIARLQTARDGWQGSPFAAPARAVARWWSVRRTIAALAAVDDATLRDIGIARSDIEGAARRGLL